MEEADKLRLIKNRKYIVENLRIKDIEDDLYQNDVINTEDMQHIRAKDIEYDRVRYVLEVLPYKGPLAYSNFRAAIEEKYQHIGKKLDETNVSELMREKKKKRIKPLITDWFGVADVLSKDAQCLRQWMIVGRALSVPEHTLVSIDHDYGFSGVKEKIFQVLSAWINITGQQATTLRCAQVLSDRGYENLADQILGYL